MKNEPRSHDNTIDSRDFQARIEELEEERDDLENAVVYADDELEEADSLDNTDDVEAAMDAVLIACKARDEWKASPEAEELKTLTDFKAEVEGYCDWDSGEQFINESYFQAYQRCRRGPVQVRARVARARRRVAP